MTGGADAPPPVPQLGAHSAVPQAGGVAIGDDEDGPLDSRLVSKVSHARSLSWKLETFNFHLVYLVSFIFHLASVLWMPSVVRGAAVHEPFLDAHVALVKLKIKY